MRKYILVIAMSVCALILSQSAGFAQMSVDEIVTSANNAAYYAGNDGRSHVILTITDSQGRSRTREFIILRFDLEDGGEQKFYVYFKKPEDVRGMVYMVWKHLDKDDDRWLYLPALDLVRRVAATDKRSSFVGSDFAYEDVSGRSITDDAHVLIEETNKYYKLKNTPKDKDLVEFAYFDIWIDKKTFIPTKAEYYNDQGELYKLVEALEIKEIQGFPTVVRSRVTQKESGSSTVAEFKDIKYDLGLEDSIFTERFLRRPPRQWLQ